MSTWEPSRTTSRNKFQWYWMQHTDDKQIPDLTQALDEGMFTLK